MLIVALVIPVTTSIFKYKSSGDTTNLSVLFNGTYLLFPSNITLTNLDPTVKLSNLSDALPSITVVLYSTPLINTLIIVLLISLGNVIFIISTSLNLMSVTLTLKT